MTQSNTNDTQTFTWIQGELFDYPEGYEFLGMSWTSLLWQKRSEMPEEYRVKGTGRYKYVPTQVSFYTNEQGRGTRMELCATEVPLRTLLFVLKNAKRPKHLTNP